MIDVILTALPADFLERAAPALAVALLVLAGLSLFRRLVVRRLAQWARGTVSPLDDILVDVVGATRSWFIVIVAVLAGLAMFGLTEAAARPVDRLAMVVVFLQLAIWTNTAITGVMDRVVRKRSGGTLTTTSAIGFVIRVGLWSLLLLLLLDNLGFDVTTIVASLGIGGIAVALALQNILGDLFASLAIALDKPVVPGDFVAIGEFMGTVEHIGLKTTQLRSLSGEQIILANGDLLGSRIRNYKRMNERRVVLQFGVTYQTPPEKLRRIPALVGAAIGRQSPTRLDRAHLCGFGDSSLECEAVYFILSPDYNTFMDVQQAVALELIEAFTRDAIEFAYPTRTLHMVSTPPELV